MSSLSRTDLQYRVPSSLIRDTLDFFQRHGRHGGEGVVLWAGSVCGRICHLRGLVIPAQQTTIVSFKIPTTEMVRIVNWTADNDLVLAVQIHSHPEEAFHSEADNHLAALQHLNAISIVVPYLGGIPQDRFFTEAAVFCLRGPADWAPLAPAEIPGRFQVLQERHELDYSSHPDHHHA